jgi:hypothetical protein
LFPLLFSLCIHFIATILASSFLLPHFTICWFFLWNYSHQGFFFGGEFSHHGAQKGNKTESIFVAVAWLVFKFVKKSEGKFDV